MQDKLHGDLKTALEYVYANSLRARMFKKQTRRLVNDSLWEIHNLPLRQKAHMQKSDMVAHVDKRMRVGNPIIVMLILQILVGIIARLVVNWWFSNRR